MLIQMRKLTKVQDHITQEQRPFLRLAIFHKMECVKVNIKQIIL